MKTEFKVGDFVYVDNPFWNLYNRNIKTHRRKIKAIIDDVVFFNDGTTQIKYIKKL